MILVYGQMYSVYLEESYIHQQPCDPSLPSPGSRRGTLVGLFLVELETAQSVLNPAFAGMILCVECSLHLKVRVYHLQGQRVSQKTERQRFKPNKVLLVHVIEV